MVMANNQILLQASSWIFTSENSLLSSILMISYKIELNRRLCRPCRKSPALHVLHCCISNWTAVDSNPMEANAKCDTVKLLIVFFPLTPL